MLPMASSRFLRATPSFLTRRFLSSTSIPFAGLMDQPLKPVIRVPVPVQKKILKRNQRKAWGLERMDR